jgi:hypothetical protein
MVNVKTIVGSIVACCLLLPQITVSYFEDRFFCEVSSEQITVSLHEGETLCFTYIAKITDRITELQEDIRIAQQFIQRDLDVQYWSTVWSSLLERKNQFLNSRRLMIDAMEDYEKELFLRVKWLISFYLKPEYDALTKKIAQADFLLAHLRLTGNGEMYPTILQRRDELYREWLLLEAIKTAHSFETLLFPLKTYLHDYPSL